MTELEPAAEISSTSEAIATSARALPTPLEVNTLLLGLTNPKQTMLFVPVAAISVAGGEIDATFASDDPIALTCSRRGITDTEESPKDTSATP